MREFFLIKKKKKKKRILNKKNYYHCVSWQLKNNIVVKCLFSLAHHVPHSKIKKSVAKNYLIGSHTYFVHFEKSCMLSWMCCTLPRKCWSLPIKRMDYIKNIYANNSLKTRFFIVVEAIIWRSFLKSVF